MGREFFLLKIWSIQKLFVHLFCSTIKQQNIMCKVNKKMRKLHKEFMEFFKRKKQQKLQLLREQTIKRINYLTIRYISVYGNNLTHVDDFMKARYVNELIKRI